MSNVPLPPIYENHAGKWIDVEDARAYAAAVSAAKDAEIAGLRAELIKSLADNKGLRAEVAGLREDAARYRWLRSPNTGPATIWELISDECNPPYMTLKYGANLDAAIDAALAARKGEA